MLALLLVLVQLVLVHRGYGNYNHAVGVLFAVEDFNRRGLKNVLYLVLPSCHHGIFPMQLL